MTVSAELLAILACPSSDHAPLRLQNDGASAVTDSASSGTPSAVSTAQTSAFAS